MIEALVAVPLIPEPEKSAAVVRLLRQRMGLAESRL